MDTETKVIGSVDDIRQLISLLEKAVIMTEENDEMSWVRVVLEQCVHSGPWRLTIGVMPIYE